MNRLQALWGRLSPTERIMVAAGVPLVALAAIWSSRSSSKKKAAAEPPAAAYGTPQQFNGSAYDLLRQLDPVINTVSNLPDEISKVTTQIIEAIPTQEIPRPSVPPAPAPAAAKGPVDAYASASNVELVQTANDLIYSRASDAGPLIDALAVRVHNGRIRFNEPAWHESQDMNAPLLQVHTYVAARLSQLGWGS